MVGLSVKVGTVVVATSSSTGSTSGLISLSITSSIGLTCIELTSAFEFWLIISLACLIASSCVLAKIVLISDCLVISDPTPSFNISNLTSNFCSPDVSASAVASGAILRDTAPVTAVVPPPTTRPTSASLNLCFTTSYDISSLSSSYVDAARVSNN